MGVGDAAGAAAGTSSVIGACWCAMGIGARQSRGGDNTAAVATSAVTGANAQLPPTTPFAARPSPPRPVVAQVSMSDRAPLGTEPPPGPVGWLHPPTDHQDRDKIRSYPDREGHRDPRRGENQETVRSGGAGYALQSKRSWTHQSRLGALKPQNHTTHTHARPKEKECVFWHTPLLRYTIAYPR